MPRALARFNRRVTNPVLRHVAAWAQSDWLRNLLAAGGGHVIRRRRRIAVTRPRVVHGGEAMALLPTAVRTVLRPFDVDAVVVLTPS
jgi:hypothetical protein